MALDFSQVKKWYIPVNGVQKEVSSVSDSYGNILWKSGPDLFVTLKEVNGNVFQLSHNKTTDNGVSYTNDGDLQYSTDKSTWTSWNYDNATASSEITSNANGEIYLRQSGGTRFARRLIISTSNVNVKPIGDARLLVDYTNYENVQPSKAMFLQAFQGNTTIYDARELLLPFTSASESMFSNMFASCTNLQYAPIELLLSTINDSGCNRMFYNCQSLLVAPKMTTASVTGSYSLYYMFDFCSSLTLPPQDLVIASGSLGSSACSAMFYGCTSLTKCVPITYSGTLTRYSSYHFSNMYYGCTSLTQVNKILITALLGNSCNAMYRNSSIKLYNSSSGTHTQAYRVPFSGTGSAGSNALKDMFLGTGGDVTTPTINTTYYIDNSIEIV